MHWKYIEKWNLDFYKEYFLYIVVYKTILKFTPKILKTGVNKKYGGNFVIKVSF